MSQRILGCVFSLILFTACYKGHLYVQQEWVDRNFLASTHVGTPDPRQACFLAGQRLLVAWRFPLNWVDFGLKMILTVRFWDHSEKEFLQPIDRSKGYAAFNFFDERILTYQIRVIDSEGKLIETWEHHFWTKLIDIDRSKLSVSSQPIQGSVIETP